MAKGARTYLTNDRFAIPQTVIQRLEGGGTAGNVTSSPATTEDIFYTTSTAGGTVSGAILSVTMGVDVTNPLSISVQCTNVRSGNTLFSTVPSIAKAAGNVFASTANGASTGVVAAVLQNTAVLPGDVIKTVWTLTRTASPGTEMADAHFKLVINETQDFDPVVS